MKPRVVLLLPAILLVFPVAGRCSPLSRGQIQFEYRAWTLEGDSSGVKTTVSQFRVPVTAFLQAGAARFVITGAGAASTAGADGAPDATLGGVSDVAAQAFVPVIKDRLLLQAGVNLPTGKRELDSKELEVASSLAHPILGFRLREYGRGFDASVGAAAAYPVAPGLLAGIGVGIVEHGAYTVTAGGDKYDPALEFSVSAGLDIAAGEQEVPPVRLDAVWRSFGVDRLGGVDAFGQGNQFELSAGGEPRGAGLPANLLARIVLQEDDTIYQTGIDTLGTLKARAGNQYLVLAGADLPVGERFRLRAEAEWTHFTGVEDGLDAGDAYGAGPMVTVPVLPNVVATARARILAGTIKGGSLREDQRLRGYHLATGIVLTGF